MMRNPRKTSYIEGFSKIESGSAERTFHRVLKECLQELPSKTAALELASEAPDWLDSDPRLAEECSLVGKLYEDEPLFTEDNILDLPLSKVEANIDRMLSVFHALSKKYNMTSCTSHSYKLKKIEFEIKDLPKGFRSAFLACFLYVSKKYLSYILYSPEVSCEKFASARLDLLEVLFLLIHNRKNTNLLGNSAKVIETILLEEFIIFKKKYPETDFYPTNLQMLSDFMGLWVQCIDFLAAHYASQEEVVCVQKIYTEFMIEYLEFLIKSPKFLSLNMINLSVLAGEKFERSPSQLIYQLFGRKILHIMTQLSITGPNTCQLFLYNLLHCVKYLTIKEALNSPSRIGEAILSLLQTLQDSYPSALYENILAYKLLSLIGKKIPEIFKSEILHFSLARHIEQAASLLRQQSFENYSIFENRNFLTLAFRFLMCFQVFDQVFPKISIDLKDRDVLVSLIGDYVNKTKKFTFSKIYDIFSSQFINYTAPQEILLESILKESSNHGLIQAFASVMNALMLASQDNPSDAIEKILLDFENADLTEEMIFGNGRLLFNLIDLEPVSSIDYFQCLSSAFDDKMWSVDGKENVVSDIKHCDILQKLNAIKRIWDVLIDREMEMSARDTLERTLLLLASRNEIALIFLDLPFEMQKSMGLAIESRPSEFFVSLLQKCLVVLKYTITLPETIFRKSNIVNDIIQFIYQNILKPSNLESHGQFFYTLYDLIISFLSPDKDSPHYFDHLNSIYNFNAWKYLLPNEVPSSEAHNILSRFLMLIEIFYTQSETIKENIKEQGVLSKIHFASNCVSLSLQLPDIAMQHNILLKIIKLAFEKEIDITKSIYSNVNNPYFIFVSIKLLRSLAKRFSVWKEKSIEYLLYIMQTIGPCFNSIYVLSTSHWDSGSSALCPNRTGITDELIHFLFVYTIDSERASVIAQEITKIALFHSNPNTIKKFFRRLYALKYDSMDMLFYNFLEEIIEIFQNMLAEKSHMELFSFNGNCGIEVIPYPDLFHEGYGFFGWLRIERNEITHPMTIFHLFLPKEIEIELIVNANSQLCYSQTSLKSKDTRDYLQISERTLPDSKWVFVEFYHFADSFFLYFDGELVKKGSYKKFYTKKSLKGLTGHYCIGCKISKIEKEDEYVIENGFNGQMGTLNFVSVNSAALLPIHDWLRSHFKEMPMHDLFSILAHQKPISVSGNPEPSESTLLNRLVLCVNPKSAPRICKPGEKIFELSRKGSKSIEILNPIKTIINNLKIFHNIPAREVIGNIGGARCFLPFLSKLTQIYLDEPTLNMRNKLVAKILRLACLCFTSQNSISFFEGSDDLLLLRYMLEQLASNGGLSDEVLNATSMMEKIVGKYYPSAMEKYLENISLNIDIWIHSPTPMQHRMMEQFGFELMFQKDYLQLVKAPKIFDLLLNCIEVYNIQENSQEDLIKLLVAISSSLGNKYFTGDLLHIVMSYVNIYFARRLNNYTYQIRSILLIFHELFHSNKASIDFLKLTIKEDKESKIIVGILSIFDYYFFQQYYKGKKSYLEKKSKRRSDKELKVEIWGANSEETIDEIIAITSYWLLTFDFSLLSEFRWKKQPQRKEKKNVLGFLINHIEKTGGLALWKSSLMTYVFGNYHSFDTPFFGVASYYAFISICLKINLQILNGRENRQQEISKIMESHIPVKKQNLIKNKIIFHQIFQNIHKFTIEARSELIADLLKLHVDQRLVTELCEDPTVLDVLFSRNVFLENFTKLCPLHSKLLYHLMDDPKLLPSFIKVLQVFSFESWYQLQVVTGLLDSILAMPLNVTSEYKCCLLFLAQYIEEIVIKDPTQVSMEKTIQAFSKFTYVLYHSGVMYVSYPMLRMFDERGVYEISKFDSLVGKGALREGGFIRIMLKLLFIFCKFDKTNNGSIHLLKFYLFKTKEERKKVKLMAGITKQEEKSDKTHLKINYNLTDLIFKTSTKAISKHKEISKAFQKGIVAEYPTVLDLKTGEKTKQSIKNNIFNNRGFLFNYLITQCLQLVLFEFYQLSSIEQIPIDTVHSPPFIEFRNKPAEYFSKMNPNIKCYIEIIHIFIEKEQSLQNIPKKKPSSLCSKFEKLLTEAKLRIGLYSKAPKLTIPLLHSVLNQVKLNEKEGIYYSIKKESHDFVNSLEEKKDTQELLKSCISNIHSFFNSLFGGIKNEKVSFEYSLIVLLNGMIFWNNLFSSLLFTTTHQFLFIDSYVWNNHYDFERVQISAPDEMQIKLISKLKTRIRNNFAYIRVPYEKMFRDELREEFMSLSSIQYKKFEKEVTAEVGIQYDKRADFEHRNFIEYVKSRYNKVLKKCPLYNMLEEEGRIRPNSFTELVTLSLCRDSLGRAQKFKRLKLSKLSDPNAIKMLFKYLRYFALKKFLILRLIERGKSRDQVISKDFFARDFQNSVQKNLYITYSSFVRPLSTNLSSSADCLSDSDAISVSTSISIPQPCSQFEEFLPRDSKVFEVEIVLPRGAVFGKLILNTICLSFKTEERKQGAKYFFGSTSYNHYFKSLKKKWRLKTIKEVIVKRYNLIRQAVEIYFDNSKSLFILFFSEEKMKKFLTLLSKLPGSWEIVNEPEKYFLKSKFAELWAANEISNFQYLILLNKYGGRTFNDIGQYPVFPWVIGDYDSPKLDLRQPKSFRDLSRTIAGMTEIKRELAKAKFEILKLESEADAFQFGTHYLAARTVLGYLLRIEPFASHLIAFEGGMDASERMFHILNICWNGCQNDVSDNRELIPEFFYLPEMFGNYNNYSFGNRNAENDKNAPKLAHVVRVDQAVMPRWAKDNHHFIKKNFLALESRRTSECLNNWIDLIFGELQQNPDHYNRFKALVDEEYVRSIKSKLNHHNITEIQEFGSIPIKIFKTKHPEKNLIEFDRRNKFLIFPRENSEEAKFAIILIKQFISAITFIECFKTRFFVVTKNQQMSRSKEEYLNVAHDKQAVFEKTDIQLYPHRTLYNTGCLHMTSDARRNIIFLDGGNLVITCKHFDDSCKITNTLTGEVVQHLYHHKAMVMSICASNNGFCSGSVDGVLAKWDLTQRKSKEPSRVEWSVCDHQSSINSIDVCDEIDLVATASTDGTISLRQLSSGKFLRLLHPPLQKNNNDYNINQIRLSPRGYILLILRSKYIGRILADFIQVFSTNGEFIREALFEGSVNCIVMDKHGYQFILGGSGIALCRYNLLSLKPTILLDYLDEEQPNQRNLKVDLVSLKSTITALCLTPFENYQQLLIGLSNGKLLSFKYSPRLTGGKIFGHVQFVSRTY